MGGPLLAEIFYHVGKKKVKVALAQDEVIDDRLLNVGMLMYCPSQYIAVALLMLYAAGGMADRYDNHTFLMNLAIAIVLLILNALYQGFYMRKMIGFVKSYNPSKYGDVLDIRFVKKWVDSCDEREQLEVYKAGYAAYRAIMMALFIALILVGVLTVTLPLSIYPLLMIIILYLVAVISYSQASI